MIGATILEWREAALSARSPRSSIEALLGRQSPADSVWIALADAACIERQLARLSELADTAGGARELPLYGVPFAVKDNIDVAGLPTTAACPDFAYTPEISAGVVRRLQDAGAVLIGKTNLDQFATGLVGTRSPYGVVRNSFDSRYISGGSSSGSAVAVARGDIPFALGTDTAGSGPVPAGLNNVVGPKPTRGRIGASGVVPACRTLDCVSVLALTVDDALQVCQLGTGFDAADVFSRNAPSAPVTGTAGDAPRYAIPLAPEFYDDRESAACWTRSLQILEEHGVQLEARDLSVLDQVAALLYDGPWVAERYAAIAPFITQHPHAVHEVVRDIILGATKYSATDAYLALYRLAELQPLARKLLDGCDGLLVPTAPCHLLVDDVLADPVRLNSRLGKYTNFVNLLDWCALSVPAGMRADGLPFGVTLITEAWREAVLCEQGRLWQRWLSSDLGATGKPVPEPGDTPPPELRGQTAGTVQLAVVGAHLSGMPLNDQLTSRGGRLVTRTTTAPRYRLYALPDTHPAKPGLARDTDGVRIEVEVWELPVAAFGNLVSEVPPPLGIGSVELDDGRWVKGFICEGYAITAARDISSFGGWRAYQSDASG